MKWIKQAIKNIEVILRCFDNFDEKHYYLIHHIFSLIFNLLKIYVTAVDKNDLCLHF